MVALSALATRPALSTIKKFSRQEEQSQVQRIFASVSLVKALHQVVLTRSSGNLEHAESESWQRIALASIKSRATEVSILQ